MTYRHHIIPKHEWKVRFGTLEGVNASDNVVILTAEQHSEVHKLLWELNGRWEDKIAWLALSGHIGKEEIIRSKQTLPNVGRTLSEKSKNKIRKSLTGKILTQEHRNKIKDGVVIKYQDPKFREMQRKSASLPGDKNPFYGRVHSDEFKKRRSEEMRGISKPKIKCQFCGVVGGVPIMHRYHLDNCKQKGV